MMSGRTNGTEGIVEALFRNLLNSFEYRTDRLQSSREGFFRDDTIRTVERAHPFLRCLPDFIEKSLVVKHGNFSGSRLSTRTKFQVLQNSFGLKTIPDGYQPLRVFRVGTGVMLQKKRMGIETGVHRSEKK
jgi:hypothetical protein